MQLHATTAHRTTHATALGAVMVALGILAAVAPVLATIGPVGLMGLLACMAGGVELMFVHRPGAIARGPHRFAFGMATMLAGVLLLGGTTGAVANPVRTLAFVLAGGGLLDLALAGGHQMKAGRRWLAGNAALAVAAAGWMAWQAPDRALVVAAAVLGARLLVRGLAMEGLGATPAA